MGRKASAETSNRPGRNITSITAGNGPSPGVTTYTLDALYRLITVDAPGTAFDEAFSYDRLGNRLTAIRGGTAIGATGSTTSYLIYTPATQTGSPGYTPAYNNRLKEIRIGSAAGTPDSSLIFDSEGRLTSQTGSTTRTLTWEAKGRLNSLLQGGKTETYAYDPSNHRIGRSGGTLGNLYYYLEGEHLESVEQGGAIQEKYFRGSTIDELVAGYVNQSGKLVPFLFQHDQVMSVSTETNPNGGTQASLAYFAFGEKQATTGTPISRLQYTGRESDGNGLYFYRARTYDPVIGRFISEDPKAFAAGQNFYAYVGNNPCNSNDPSGELCASCAWETLTDGVRSGSIMNNAYKSFDAGVQLTAGAGQMLLAATYGKLNGTSAYLMTAGVANIQGAGKKYFNIAVNEEFLPTDNFLQNSYQDAAKIIGLNPKVGTAAYNIAELGTGLYGELKPAKIAEDWNYGLTVTGPKYVTPISQEQGATLANSVLGLGKGAYDAVSSSFDALSYSGSAAGGFLIYPNKPNTNQMQSVYRK